MQTHNKQILNAKYGRVPQQQTKDPYDLLKDIINMQDDEIDEILVEITRRNEALKTRNR